MTPQAEQLLLDNWAHDSVVGDPVYNRNDRLARAIILDNRKAIANHYGFETHEQYLADLDARFDLWKQNHP